MGQLFGWVLRPQNHVGARGATPPVAEVEELRKEMASRFIAVEEEK